jgi:hypothetical protein
MPLLQEISLASIQPYATQFAWEDHWGDGSSWSCKIQAEQVAIQFKILSEGYSGTRWNFGFWMPSAAGAFTTSASGGAAGGQLSYLRILSTCLEALRDFANTHTVDYMDISGADSSAPKGAQKSRIYMELFKANANMFPDFTVTQPNADKLVLTRTQRYDATGVPTQTGVTHND